MPPDTNPDLRSISFQIVEDNQIALKVAAEILREMGAVDIASASDGVRALAYLDRADPSPDVLLVDLSMPEMGGVEFMRELAKRDYGGSVVLVSGADETTLNVAVGLAKYRGINVLGYVVKPVTHQSLAEILNKL